MSTTRSPPELIQRPNPDHTQWLMRRIWNRVNRKNEHFVGCIVGREGSGKSYTAIKIASVLDPSFTSERVIFDVADLLRVLKDGDHEPGNFYVLDEAGVQLGVRTWQERGQVLANQALQLVRNHNLGLLFTLPRLGELDSQAQGRLQAFLELTEKKDGEYVRGKWKNMDPDRSDETGKIYKKFPRRKRGVPYTVKVKSVAFSPPAAELVAPYEAKKTRFQEEFYEKTIESLGGGEDGDDGESEEELSVKDVAMMVADDDLAGVVSRHTQNQQPYINADLIRAEYEITHRDARAVKSLLEQQYSTEELDRYA